MGIPANRCSAQMMRGRPLQGQVDEIVKVYTEKYFPVCERNKVRIVWEPYQWRPRKCCSRHSRQMLGSDSSLIHHISSYGSGRRPPAITSTRFTTCT